MLVGITGSNGFIGWHLRAFLKREGVDFCCITKEHFNNIELMKKTVSSVDIIIHLAGLNRGDDKIIYETNVMLCDKIIEACVVTKSKPHIIFASSIHYNRDTGYGRSKKECMLKLHEWSQANESLVTNVILPNVFGEFAKPFYNSVVSTFCYQLANKIQPQIINDIETEQVHVQEVTRCVYSLFGKKMSDFNMCGQKITVKDILGKLLGFEEVCRKHEIPDVRNIFDRNLFNTYRSYKYPHDYPKKLDVHSDNRGSLVEAAKCSGGGQVLISTTNPNFTRGNHYHERKIERFMVIGGEAEIKTRKLFEKETQAFIVSGKDRVYIDMPTFYTHNITNIGEGELLVMFWCNEVFNDKDPDTFFEEV